MKIVIISDIHGRDKWKQQVEEPADHYVFLGDYFDSFDISGDKQIENFKDIVEFKRQNHDKVTLLCGNHDHPNYCAPDFIGACSGFQNDEAFLLRTILEPKRENGEIQVCKIIGKYLFVHAGLTQTWCMNNNINLEEGLEKQINDLFQKDLMPFIFQENPKKMDKRGTDPYGNNLFQGPMWVRPDSLKIDKVPGYIQVVGHTGVNDLTLEQEIWFTDCQGHTEKPLILEI